MVFVMKWRKLYRELLLNFSMFLDSSAEFTEAHFLFQLRFIKNTRNDVYLDSRFLGSFEQFNLLEQIELFKMMIKMFRIH